jgi:hypothetical protein
MRRAAGDALIVSDCSSSYTEKSPEYDKEDEHDHSPRRPLSLICSKLGFTIRSTACTTFGESKAPKPPCTEFVITGCTWLVNCFFLDILHHHQRCMDTMCGSPNRGCFGPSGTFMWMPLEVCSLDYVLQPQSTCWISGDDRERTARMYHCR